MPISTIVPQQISRLGIEPTLAPANEDGSYVANDGRMYLEVANANTTDPVTVTIETPGVVDGLAITDLTVIVPVAAEGPPIVPEVRKIGPFPRNIYNNAAGNIKVTFSVFADVTIAAFRL